MLHELRKLLQQLDSLQLILVRQPSEARRADCWRNLQIDIKASSISGQFESTYQ